MATSITSPTRTCTSKTQTHQSSSTNVTSTSTRQHALLIPPKSTSPISNSSISRVPPLERITEWLQIWLAVLALLAVVSSCRALSWPVRMARRRLCVTIFRATLECLVSQRQMLMTSHEIWWWRYPWTSSSTLHLSTPNYSSIWCLGFQDHSARKSCLFVC